VEEYDVVLCGGKEPKERKKDSYNRGIDHLKKQCGILNIKNMGELVMDSKPEARATDAG
jgi:hypothetical protein